MLKIPEPFFHESEFQNLVCKTPHTVLFFYYRIIVPVLWQEGLDVAYKKSYAESRTIHEKGYKTMEQKKALVLQDLSCTGRAGLTQAMCALSAMGHQCVPLPTAVYSGHAGITGFAAEDLTQWLQRALAHYAALDLQFDAIQSGFLNTPEQVACVLLACARKKTDGIFLVDPVMGDNGKLYKICTPALVQEIQRLCEAADFITPNVTEAAVLLGYTPDTLPDNLEDAKDWVHRLCCRYATRTVLTGLGGTDTICTLCGQEGQVTTIETPRIGAYYPGTGDLFAAVLLGGLLKGNSMEHAAQAAADFVCACISETCAQRTDPKWGVLLEPQLWRLTTHDKRFD